MSAWFGRIIGMTPQEDALPTKAETRMETARNTRDTDRKINQIVESVSQNSERAGRRAERSANMIKWMAEQALHLTNSTRDLC